MIEIIKSKDIFTSDYGWLLTKHHFSFGPYFDLGRMSFGALRVFNDDVVQPGTGFGMHPHHDMEIITVVKSGALEHTDSMGNREIIKAGEVQRMTAGTGIMHSEMNPSKDEPVRFMQIWFIPNQLGLTPSYETKRFALEDQKNRLLLIASGKAKEGDLSLFIHQDVNIYLSQLEGKEKLAFQQEEGRRTYLLLMDGELLINGERLENGDVAQITETTDYRFETSSQAHFIMMDLA